MVEPAPRSATDGLSFDELKMGNQIQCFETKQPDACFALGNLFAQVDKREDKAAKLYQYACDTYKHAPSCYYLSNYFYYARGNLYKDTKKFLEYGNLGCDYGNGDSCKALAGFFHPEHTNIPFAEESDFKMQDFNKTMKYFEKGCQNNSGKCCYEAGKVYLYGCEKFKFDKHPEKALAFNIKACERGERGGCFLAYHQYKDGEGVKANDRLAKLCLSKFENMDIDVDLSR
ncbi:cytochrome c oxidase assembly factor 7B-like [Ylistrum balloti]|uniref:cytochrome c oxidase assembly factor 7B-like n=1 Tax=Ylistrum balloti TaxID=509963 RepID=UPI002905C43A|nr:cytochrome c oxidase assembly factor 7B-like [Ylistrum balloti]